MRIAWFFMKEAIFFVASDWQGEGYAVDDLIESMSFVEFMLLKEGVEKLVVSVYCVGALSWYSFELIK